ncbi:DUF4900 domain-containing protein [Deinococcus apachensis]|uniref:DUF4900 domain-containing protein n=1 Tax=Deinococcus apachensis TaxID=309886 RepID=UPI00037016F4|nr:DUF4900 domain-containing protein [Deinococcus apachensis]
MHRPTQGFALASALAVMVLVLLITFMLTSNSVSELMQTNSSQGLVRARALAEASVAQVTGTLVNEGLKSTNDVLKPYATAFSTSGKSADQDPIIPEGSYSSVLTALNGMSGTTVSIVAPDNGGSSTGQLQFTNMRVDEASFSKAGQVYYVDYTIQGVGTSSTFRRTVTTGGTMRLVLGRQYLNQYVLLADDGGSTSGGYFGTGSAFDGPVHFNKNLALAGTPVFQYGLTVASPTTLMYNCSARTWQATANQTNDCTQPGYGGYGQQHVTDSVPLPNNAYSQARAALGLDENNATDALTNAEICQATGQTSSCVPTSGVYVPKKNGSVSGGIFIQGNAQDVRLSVNGSNQVYNITDAAGVVTRIEVSYTAKTTTVTSGSTSTTLQGVPNGQLYANGSILSLQGPARTGTVPSPAPSNSVPTQVPPALAPDSQLNIASSGDMKIQGDLTYTNDPRQSPNAKNVLGLISGQGHVLIGRNAPNDVYVMGSMLAGASGKGLKVEGIDEGTVTFGNRGKIHLFGSLAESLDQLRGLADGNFNLAKGYDDDFHYDKRFLNGGAVPPYFPATTKFTANTFWPSQRTWEEQ